MVDDWSMGVAAADEVDGKIQVVDAPGCPRQGVIVLATLGHYTILADGDELLLLRREGGGYAVASVTERGSGQQAWPGGERQKFDTGLLGRKSDGTWAVHVRIRGTELEVFGATKISLDGDVKIVRDGDSVAAAAGFTGHTHTHVCAFTGLPVTSAAPIYAGDVGRCVAGATKVTAG